MTTTNPEIGAPADQVERPDKPEVQTAGPTTKAATDEQVYQFLGSMLNNVLATVADAGTGRVTIVLHDRNSRTDGWRAAVEHGGQAGHGAGWTLCDALTGALGGRIPGGRAITHGATGEQAYRDLGQMFDLVLQTVADAEGGSVTVTLHDRTSQDDAWRAAVEYDGQTRRGAGRTLREALTAALEGQVHL